MTVQANIGSVDLTRDLIYSYAQNTNLKTKPYPYQARVLAETLAALVKDNFYGLFLDMGTGKTLLTLYTYEQLLQAGIVDHAVIVAPKALLSTWRDEKEKHVHARDMLAWKALGAKAQERALASFTDEHGKIFLVNVEAFQTKQSQLMSFLERLMSSRRVLIAVDESSKIKSATAQRTKVLCKLSEACRYRMILTGTEITNSQLDLYTQFKFLRRDFWAPLDSYYAFRYRYAVLDTEYGPGGRSFQVVVGYQRQDELLRKITPHVSRIKKEDVLDLPPKRYQEVWLEMPGTMRRVYDQLKKELTVEYEGKELTVANMAVLFGRFRQLVGGYLPATEGGGTNIDENLKLRYLVDELEDTTEKAIVWACFTKEVELLLREIPGAVALYGHMTQAERDAAVDGFRAPDGPRVLIANPAVAAYGLNLQHCRLVYWYSNPVSPEQRWQAEDRCHRIGQTGSVLYKDLLYRDSVDVRVKQLLKDKTDGRELFRSGMKIKDVLGVF